MDPLLAKAVEPEPAKVPMVTEPVAPLKLTVPALVKVPTD